MKKFYESWALKQISLGLGNADPPQDSANADRLIATSYILYNNKVSIEKDLQSGELVSGVVVESSLGCSLVVAITKGQIGFVIEFDSTRARVDSSTGIVFVPATKLTEITEAVAEWEFGEEETWMDRVTGYCALIPDFDPDGNIIAIPSPMYYVIASDWRERNSQGNFEVSLIE
jgi:hypothetical protein